MEPNDRPSLFLSAAPLHHHFCPVTSPSERSSATQRCATVRLRGISASSSTSGWKTRDRRLQNVFLRGALQKIVQLYFSFHTCELTKADIKPCSTINSEEEATLQNFLKTTVVKETVRWDADGGQVYDWKQPSLMINPEGGCGLTVQHKHHKWDKDKGRHDGMGKVEVMFSDSVTLKHCTP